MRTLWNADREFVAVGAAEADKLRDGAYPDAVMPYSIRR